MSGQPQHLGLFTTPDDAARAYDAVVRRLCLARAVNFPETPAERDAAAAHWSKQKRPAPGSTPRRRRAAKKAALPADEEDSGGGSNDSGDAGMHDTTTKAARFYDEHRCGGRKVAAGKLHGVFHDNYGGTRWRAILRFRGTQFGMGSHGTSEEAGRAYDAGVRQHGAPLVWLNYPTARERAQMSAGARLEGGVGRDGELPTPQSPLPQAPLPLPLPLSSLEAFVRAIKPPLLQVRGVAKHRPLAPSCVHADADTCSGAGGRHRGRNPRQRDVAGAAGARLRGAAVRVLRCRRRCDARAARAAAWRPAGVHARGGGAAAQPGMRAGGRRRRLTKETTDSCMRARSRPAPRCH